MIAPQFGWIVNWTSYLLAPYVIAIFICIGLGNHARWCESIIRRQLLEVFVTIIGVILPAAVYGVLANSLLVGMLVLFCAPIPLVVIFRLRKAAYDKWVEDLQFKEKYEEKDNTPVINRRSICH
jgi:hypothetical protein